MIESIRGLDTEIRRALKWTEADAMRYVTYEERDGFIIVKERQGIPPAMRRLEFIALMKNSLEAKRLDDVKGMMRWQITKGREAEATKPSVLTELPIDSSSRSEPPPVTKNNIDELKLSIQRLPMLKEAYPVVLDEKGIPIDGWHRLEVDKDWPTVTVPIEDPIKRQIARFAVNFCRRKVTDKEKRDWITNIHLQTKLSPKELADLLPMSYSWIMKYLPDEYKDKVKAEAGTKGGVASGVARQPASSHEAKDEFGRPKVFSCGIPGCPEGTYDSERYDGIHLCARHRDLFNRDSGAVEKLKAKKPFSPQKVEKKKYDPLKPSLEERKRMMHPTKSKMEREVIQELQAEGWPIDTDYLIPLTNPDGYLHEIRLPLEVDGEQVHKGKKAERDDLVNEILRHRGIEPARERFSHYSVKRKEEIKTSFRQRMIEGYRAKGLPLPVKVQERMEAIQR